MSATIVTPPENFEWSDGLGGEPFKALAALTGAAVFIALPVVAILNRSVGLPPAVVDVAAYGGAAGIGVTLASCGLGMVGDAIRKPFNKHRDATEEILINATEGISEQLKALGYDMTLERGDRSTEKAFGQLNDRFWRLSSDVRAMANDQVTMKQALSTAFILGNEEKRDDLTMYTALQGMIAGMETFKKDPSKLLEIPPVAIRGVEARDEEKRYRPLAESITFDR
jgi:hypothetical protein